MSGLFYRKKSKGLMSSKSMEIPESSQTESSQPKQWRYRPHLKRFRRNSSKSKKNKYPHVKSLPSSFSQSSEQRSPNAGHLLINGKSNSDLLAANLRYSTDEEDSSINSGSGRLQMTAGRSSGVLKRHQLLIPDNAGHHSGSSGGGGNAAERLSPRQLLIPHGPHRTNSAISSLLQSSPLIASHNFVTEDELQGLLQQIEHQKQEQMSLQEQIEQLRTQHQTEILMMHQSLQDERERCERLEEQINDLTELHQNEIENLKQLINDMEEKVQYQSEERLRDIHEALEVCHTRISKMEHQQNQQLQQLITLDSLESSTARQLLPKIINVVLTILQVILILVATVASVIIPFFRTRLRVLNTVFCSFFMIIIYNRRHQILRFLQSHFDHPILHVISFAEL